MCWNTTYVQSSDAPDPAAAFADDSLFGMWADRKDLADVDAYIRQICAGDTPKRLAEVAGVSGDYLLECAACEAAKARFEDRELLQQFQQVQQLSDDDKHVVKRLLGAFLVKKQLQALAR